MSGSFELQRSYRFEAAHFLPKVDETHPCSRVHGHSYVVRVAISGMIDEKGWVVDFATIDDQVEPLCSRLDHQLLNEIEGLENPTSEMLATWLWRRLKPGLPGIKAVTVAETTDSSCTYRGGDGPE